MYFSMSPRKNRIWMPTLAMLGILGGCDRDGDRTQNGAYESAKAYLGLGGSDIDRVLGMEAPTSDWHILWNAPGSLASSSISTQGALSLGVQPRGWVPIQSSQLLQLGSRIGTALMIDVQFQGTNVNPSWWGTITIGVDIPSLGVTATGNGSVVNSFDFTNKLGSSWTTLSFDVSPALQALLAGNYSDLQFTITLNVPSQTTGTYLIDNLRFLGGSTPPGGVDAGVPPATCLVDWRNTTCGQFCLSQTQSDRANCSAFLDCYLAHNCGPDTCGKGPDDICGVNTVAPGMGMAPKIIADQVYQCRGCAGTTPVSSCVGQPETSPCSVGSTPCDGGADCTHQGVCLAGQCVDVSAVGCGNPAIPDGTPCDDGNRCTESDKCKVGECIGVPISYCPDLDPKCDGGVCPSVACYPGDSDELCACEVAKLNRKLEKCLDNCVGGSQSPEVVALCGSSCRTAQASLRLKVRLSCINDPDRDGVPSTSDQCKNTPPGVPVNSSGCPDRDRDGVPDDKDKCQETYDAKNVDKDGCVVDTTVCHEGNCGVGLPSCPTGTCCQIDEIRVQTVVSPDDRKGITETIIGTRAAPKVCNWPVTPLIPPTLTTPNVTATPVFMDPITGHDTGTRTQFVNGKAVGGDIIPLPFKWRAVESNCPKVRYSVQVEYLHCHAVGDVRDLSRYLNAGWCRWQTLLHKTVESTEMIVQVPMGKLMWDLHEPFKTELGALPPVNGTYDVWYQPQWVRAKVVAFDGNGNYSGVNDTQNYYVLYAKNMAFVDLERVPDAPF